MFDCPKTVEEAQKNKYGANSYKHGDSYDSTKCAYEVSEIGRRINYYQCSRPNGYGTGKLYCKQHAKKIGEE